MSPIDMISEKK